MKDDIKKEGGRNTFPKVVRLAESKNANWFPCTKTNAYNKEDVGCKGKAPTPVASGRKPEGETQ